MVEETLTPLSDRSKAIILGSLLGDGSLKINQHYKNARFSFRHSIKQKEYFLWKAKELAEIASENYMWEQSDGNGRDGWGGKKLRFQSKAIPQLTELHRLVHKGGKKTIRRKWLNMLTPLSLAVWWMDDGSLVSNSKQGVFSTDSFSLREVEILDRYMKKVWHITTKVGRTQKGYYRLWISSTGELKKFLRIILPHIPVEEMFYKVLLLYRDSELQQRWTSEVAELTNFPPDVIERQLRMKKSKWKYFR